MAKLFGTNGIRGIFSETFTLEFVHDITLSLGTFFKTGPILIGYDGRTSSPIIADVVCSTLNYMGIDCNIAHLVPTPCLEFTVKKLGYNGGIMITASHNPPNYNGIKPVSNDGVEISREDELIVEDIYFSKKWNKSKTFGKTNDETRLIQTYIDGIISNISSEKIKQKKFKVVLDLGNGVQSLTAPKLCDLLECNTVVINQTIDGNFPGRGSEPTPSNLQELSSVVLKTNSDFGIAFDGDGDRSILCDNLGQILSGDKSALLLTKFLLKNYTNSTVITCLNSGSSIEKIAKTFNSKVIRTKVGSVEVSRRMVSENALIGFEENGGFMFGKHNQVRDGAMTLGLVLDLLSHSTQSLSDEISMLPPSYTTKDKINCNKKQAIEVVDFLSKKFSNNDLTEGIKIFDRLGWIMVRPSGTEPIIRIYGESNSNENLDIMMNSYLSEIKSFLSR